MSSCILDWKLQDEEGNYYPYDVNHIVDVLTQYDLKPIKDWLALQAIDSKTFREKIEEDEIKNSLPSSSTTEMSKRRKSKTP